jgi:hypothetical protein
MISAHDRSSPARAALYSVAATGTCGGQVADAAVAQWCRIEAKLSPILGAAGVAALFRRSLYALRDARPGLALAEEASGAAGDFELLRSALVKLSQADAATAHSALMQVFRDLLAGLIGAPLSERLLNTATDFSLIGSAGEEPTP